MLWVSEHRIWKYHLTKDTVNYNEFCYICMVIICVELTRTWWQLHASTVFTSQTAIPPGMVLAAKASTSEMSGTQGVSTSGTRFQSQLGTAVVSHSQWGKISRISAMSSCNKHFIKGKTAPPNDPYAGVSILLSHWISKCVTPSGSCGPRITFIRVRSSPCNIFLVGVYIPHQHRRERLFYSDILLKLL